MTLPEQGGFNEKLSKIIDRVYLFGMNGGLSYEKFDDELSPVKAEAAIRTLILEEIIGEDRPHEEEHSSKVTKMEQRKKLGGSDGTK